MVKDTPQKSLVLYADDDSDDLELVKESFTRHVSNLELMTVSDGIQILSYLKSLSEHDPAPCLIILDINMPKMDGKQALKEIRKMARFENTPAILFTTSSQPVDKDFAKKYNAGFITKPIEYNQIEIIIRKFITHCNDETENNADAHS